MRWCGIHEDFSVRRQMNANSQIHATPENRVKELVKAGALIAAEIDRLQAL